MKKFQYVIIFLMGSVSAQVYSVVVNKGWRVWDDSVYYDGWITKDTLNIAKDEIASIISIKSRDTIISLRDKSLKIEDAVGTCLGNSGIYFNKDSTEYSIEQCGLAFARNDSLFQLSETRGVAEEIIKRNSHRISQERIFYEIENEMNYQKMDVLYINAIKSFITAKIQKGLTVKEYEFFTQSRFNVSFSKGVAEFKGSDIQFRIDNEAPSLSFLLRRFCEKTVRCQEAISFNLKLIAGKYKVSDMKNQREQLTKD